MSKEKKIYLIDAISEEDKPEVKLELTGPNGNAFAIMGQINRAWSRNRSVENYREIAVEYLKRAQSGDYNNLLAVSMQYIREPEIEEEEEYEDDYYDDEDEEDED